MLITTLAFATLLLQDPTAATAQSDQAAPARTAPAQESDDGDRLVCRRERVVGSNLPERVCLPQREWDRLRDLSQRGREQFNDRATVSPEVHTPG